jgi:chemotaxis protein MotB
MADDKPIIVVKKKGGHGGHHGGAWKIAYADFVTAMMAFFMVMWLVNSASVTTRQSIASYFRKPGIFTEGSGTPLLLGGSGILEDAFVPPKPEDKKVKVKQMTQDPQRKMSGESDRDLDKRYMQEGRVEPQRGKGPTEVLGLNSDKKQLEEVKREIKIRQVAEEAQKSLQKVLTQMPEISKLLGKVDLKVEADGLKIEIMDTDKVSMFDSGSPRIRKEAEAAFAKVTEIIKKYPNNLEISGHTDATPFPSRSGGYTNWELSADRANAARRLIESQGFPGKQIVSVIGKAATEPKLPEAPNDPPNRRITLKMKIDLDKPFPGAGPGESTKPLEDLLSPPPGQQSIAISTPEPGSTPYPTPTPTETPTSTPTSPPAAAVHIKGAEPTDRIKLPDGPPITANPDYMPDDKIFNKSPVLGPAELYSGR